MDSHRARASQVVRSFLSLANKDGEVGESTPLFTDGIGLDSLETAELSALLEDEFGRDPFSEGDLPATLGDVLDYYAAGEPQQSASV